MNRRVAFAVLRDSAGTPRLATAYGINLHESVLSLGPSCAVFYRKTQKGKNMLAKDKAYVCNQCRKVITYSRTDAGKTIPCPFCKAPARLPVAADFIVSDRRDRPAKRSLFIAAAVLAVAALAGVFLVVRTPVKASPAVQAIAPVFRLLQKSQPVAVPGTARARGQQATLGVTDVVYGCPEIREATLNRTSLVQTPVCFVKVTVTNTGKKSIPFRTWRSHDLIGDAQKASLTDPSGNSFSLVAYGTDSYPVGACQQDELAPGASLTDLVLFLCEAKPGSDLELTLPCENIGGKGNIRFAISRDLIR